MKDGKAPSEPGEVVELQPSLRRIVAPNASPMTFRGTNTYLLGKRDIAVIDPGPPDQDHLDAILDAQTANQRISHIFVTHSHADHSPLALALAQTTGAKTYAFGPSKMGRAPIMERLSGLGGGEGIDESFMPDIALTDGEIVEGTSWSLKAHHTPGHLGNHLCFEWIEGNAVFSGDTVMGWASSLVSPPDGHLTDFMNSLEKLAKISAETTYFPGHGDPIVEPLARIQALTEHRRDREGQILKQLEKGPQTISEMTADIYVDVDKSLHPAAERNLLAHLIDLAERGLVTCDGQFSAKASFSLTV